MFIYFSRFFLIRFFWGLAKSSGNLCWLPWGEFLMLIWNVLHEDTVPVMVGCMGQNVICKTSYCFVSRGTSHISVYLFLLPFIICCPFLTDISFLSSLMMHPSSHKNPNDISGLFSTLIKCEFTWLVYLVLAAVVTIYVMTPLCYYLALFMSCNFKLWLGPFLWWLVLLGVYLQLSLQFPVFLN